MHILCKHECELFYVHRGLGIKCLFESLDARPAQNVHLPMNISRTHTVYKYAYILCQPIYKKILNAIIQTEQHLRQIFVLDTWVVIMHFLGHNRPDFPLFSLQIGFGVFRHHSDTTATDTHNTTEK